MDNDSQKKTWDWKEYYDKFKDTPRTKSLAIAVEKYCKDKGYALDIGAGNLRDTKFLLDEGFTVVAVDPSPLSIKLAKELNNPSLTFVPDVIQKYDFPKDHFNIVNAQGMMFHFLEPDFNTLIHKIKDSLKSGGVFCTEFMGEKDDWNYPGTPNTIVTKEKINTVLEGFEVVFQKELEDDQTPVLADTNKSSKIKHWHILKVIARKK